MGSLMSTWHNYGSPPRSCGGTRRARLWPVLGTLALAAMCRPIPTEAQNPLLLDADLPDGALDLVVEITSSFDSVPGYSVQLPIRESRGTGILLEVREDAIFVLTARHVVQDIRRRSTFRFQDSVPQPASALRVCFHLYDWTRDPWNEDVENERVCLFADTESDSSIVRSKWEAEWLDTPLDQLTDIAVLRIPNDTLRTRHLRADMQRRGDPTKLSVGDPVAAVGCSSGLAACWRGRATDRVVGLSEEQIQYATFSVRGGDSGGPLFNEWGEVVGMNIALVPGNITAALRIDHVLSTIDSLGLGDSISLSRPKVPRQGYPLDFGVSLMGYGGESPLFPGGTRLPSIRATSSIEMWRNTGGPFSLRGYVGYHRVAIDNLSVNSGVAGMSFGWSTRVGSPFVERVGARFFLEAGGGHIQGRMKVSEFELDGSNRDLFETLEDDGLGGGGGIALEFTVRPHTTIELSLGRWEFSRPDGLPGMPGFLLGTGMRLGL